MGVTPLQPRPAGEEAMTSRRTWVEIDGPLRVRLPLAAVVILTVCLILFTAWILWDQNRLIAVQQGEITRLREYILEIEERLGILNQIRSHRPVLPHAEAAVMADAVQREATRYGFDWWLLVSIIRVESGFDRRARSPRGAVGLMQVMPATLREVASDLGWEARDLAPLEDIRVNVRVGAHYLFTLVERFGDLELAVQAYYLGPARVSDPSDEWGDLGRRYVRAVGIEPSSPGG